MNRRVEPDAPDFVPPPSKPPPRVAPTPLLTVKEAAALLKITRHTLYALIRRGVVPGVRRLGPGGRGRPIRLDGRILARWLAQGGQHRPTRRTCGHTDAPR